MTNDHLTLPLIEARATLVELLGQGELPKIVGLWELSTNERSFLVCTCAATVIAHMVTLTCGYDRAASVDGVEALVDGLMGQVKRLCVERPYATDESERSGSA